MRYYIQSCNIAVLQRNSFNSRTRFFMKYIGTILAATLLTILVFACTQPPEYPIEPVIEFVSLSKSEMLRGRGPEDTTFVTISFTDGDGDIGNFQQGSQNDTSDLFLKDLRTGATPEKFTIWQVPELGSGNGISGEITFQLLTTCCIFPPEFGVINGCDDVVPEYPVDTLIYEIYIVDRAGHESNRVQTDPIFLRCE